ncbi:TPA: hypothetical protein ACGO8I_001395 [Streptococcus suis]
MAGIEMNLMSGIILGIHSLSHFRSHDKKGPLRPFYFFTATVNKIGISVKYIVNDVDKKGPKIPKIDLL